MKRRARVSEGYQPETEPAHPCPPQGGSVLLPSPTVSDLNRAADDAALVDAARRVCKAVAPIIARLPCRTPFTENSRAFLPTPGEMDSARAALMALAGVLERM